MYYLSFCYFSSRYILLVNKSTLIEDLLFVIHDSLIVTTIVLVKSPYLLFV